MIYNNNLDQIEMYHLYYEEEEMINQEKEEENE